jgi:hypothetical protein
MYSYVNCEALPVSRPVSDAEGGGRVCNFHAANGTVTWENTRLRRIHISG